MSGLTEAVSLLTRIPARSNGELGRALPWFPAVGGMIGLSVGAIYAASLEVFPAGISASLAISVGIMLTGALHEDGFADTADAFGIHLAHDKTVEILKDPRLGTYGVVALTLSIAIRIASLSSLGGVAALVALPAAHGLGRASSLTATKFAPMSPSSQLGASYSNEMRMIPSVVTGISVAALALGTLGTSGFAALALAILAAKCVAAAGSRRIGGLSGDLLGATEQITEIGVLLLAAGIRHHIPWWAQ